MRTSLLLTALLALSQYGIGQRIYREGYKEPSELGCYESSDLLEEIAAISCPALPILTPRWIPMVEAWDALGCRMDAKGNTISCTVSAESVKIASTCPPYAPTYAHPVGGDLWGEVRPNEIGNYPGDRVSAITVLDDEPPSNWPRLNVASIAGLLATPPEPTDVPAIQETVPGNDPVVPRDPNHCVDGWIQNAFYGNHCASRRVLTCADKHRILIPDEQEIPNWWCHKVEP